MKDKGLTFETFVEDESNLIALDVCRRVAHQEEKACNPLWICGPSGCGKTHLLYAIFHRLQEKEGLRIRFATAEAAAEALLEALVGNGSDWGQLEDCDVLILDELDLLCGKCTTQKEIARLILTKCGNGQQVVMASRCAPAEMPLFDYLQERRETAFSINVDPPNTALRRQIALRFLASSPFRITRPALELLIERAPSVPQLKGALLSAAFYSEKNRKNVTLPWVRKHLGW
ncbi:MAG: ATP-binding protein [Clostridia bacterium]|nr:ATP-binding protein [Clostridia bacterium]